MIGKPADAFWPVEGAVHAGCGGERLCDAMLTGCGLDGNMKECVQDK